MRGSTKRSSGCVAWARTKKRLALGDDVAAETILKAVAAVESIPSR